MPSSNRRQVRLHYAKRYGRDGQIEKSTRAVNPYSLARLSMDWYLLAYCHLRQDFRIFRLARIDKLDVLLKTFDRPTNFKPDWLSPGGAQSIVVKALFKPEVARWVRETHSYYIIESEDVPEGLLVTLFVRDEREMLQWLLGWGGNVRVLQPETLCQLLLDEAKRVIQLYE